ncbi:MAG TPA: HAD-IIA family hydrolase [Tepidisphaeraceae bacterium]|nr:HAD-IIA family hydrolase [Tepidisphaeraceae bacterium]
MDFSGYSAILVDLDGTLYCETHALPGAVAFVQRLQREGRPFNCLSNTTESPIWASNRLKKMGMEIVPSAIYTATESAVDYVLERFGTRPAIYNLATAGLGELLDHRCKWVTKGDEPCDAVICGALANQFVNLDRMRVALALVRKGAACVGICADRVYPGPQGMEFGSGALTTMLAYAGGVEPVFCGKPERHFFEHACQRMSAAPQSCLLIGDNLESDILGAKALGIKTILTLTGVTSMKDLQNASPDEQPDKVVQSLLELI